jgi:electron transfer flavoprotein beta subunit
MSTKVISLVSIGAHPTSGRPRRAEQDARAVELGLQLAGDNLQVLHAGDPPKRRCAPTWAWAGATACAGTTGWRRCLPALTAYLRDAGAQVVLTGSQAETGEGSGMLPFLLAESWAGRWWWGWRRWSRSTAARPRCCKPCRVASGAA